MGASEAGSNVWDWSMGSLEVAPDYSRVNINGMGIYNSPNHGADILRILNVNLLHLQWPKNKCPQFL